MFGVPRYITFQRGRSPIAARPFCSMWCEQMAAPDSAPTRMRRFVVKPLLDSNWPVRDGPLLVPNRQKRTCPNRSALSLRATDGNRQHRSGNGTGFVAHEPAARTSSSARRRARGRKDGDVFTPMRTGIADARRGSAGRGFRRSPWQAKLAVLGFGSFLAFGGAMAVSGVQIIAGPYRRGDSDASSGTTMWHPPKIAARTSKPWASSAVWSIRWQLASRLQ